MKMSLRFPLKEKKKERKEKKEKKKKKQNIHYIQLIHVETMYNRIKLVSNSQPLKSILSKQVCNNAMHISNLMS